MYKIVAGESWRFLHIFGILVVKGPTVNSEAEQQMWVKTWARRIDALGLSSVVLSLLDIAPAFGFLGSQALLMTQPFVTGLVNDTTIDRAVTLLDSSELLERLRTYLEGEER
ncbi:MAG: hypothetical protein SWK90_12615 [Chloroflexota bacterium]|nr:hypothetical protein [Chloroflexota bacterium]